MSALREFLAWLERAPDGTVVPAASVLEVLREHATAADAAGAGGGVSESAEGPGGPTAPLPLTWRERLWLVPPETRLGVVELAEAIGRPKSWVYRRTGAACEADPLPCRKLDGELVFVAGEIRTWLAAHETIVSEAPPPAMPITPLRTRAAAGRMPGSSRRAS